MGDFGQALPSFRRAAALRPGSAAVWLQLGEAHLRLGQPDEAERCFRRTLRLRPDLRQARAALGMAARQRQELQSNEGREP